MKINEIVQKYLNEENLYVGDLSNLKKDKEINITKIKKNSNIVYGTYKNYTWEAQIYSEGSSHGWKESRLSKLWVYLNDIKCFTFERNPLSSIEKDRCPDGFKLLNKLADLLGN